ncbi:PHD finger ALFIN-LIKE 7-like isoform X1 [Olea europaea subsp. europaea]|uniref:PHD finger protein ALFIN-LIKE n=1 Tax=Olea europaea subsp. europaea TaxID=158383 RepID=A0A8S0TWH7_OLEEU|nr:PHD finger ALFIN-LIKE 7-like isoform X1 [Olea europaea subsp. europaea]
MGALRLYGPPNATWEVKPPVGQIPPEFPEPVLGINLLRDQRPENDWLSYAAICSDAWLLSIVFSSAGLCRHEKETRETLFHNINDLPTVLEVVTEAIRAKDLAASAAAADNNWGVSRRTARPARLLLGPGMAPGKGAAMPLNESNGLLTFV